MKANELIQDFSQVFSNVDLMECCQKLFSKLEEIKSTLQILTTFSLCLLLVNFTTGTFLLAIFLTSLYIATYKYTEYEKQYIALKFKQFKMLKKNDKSVQSSDNSSNINITNDSV